MTAGRQRRQPRPDVTLHGRRGGYRTLDGFYVERDEGVSDQQVWLVGLPGDANPGRRRQPVQTIRLSGAANLIAAARLVLGNPLDLDALGFTVWPELVPR